MTDDFFEPLTEPPPPERYESPVWYQSPEDEFLSLVPARHLLARTDRGVVLLPAYMGEDRPMGPGWLTVSGEQIQDDQVLAFWIEVGIDSRSA